jgi:chorismate mutase
VRPDLQLLFEIPLADCRWTLQEMSMRHIFPAEATECEEGPIVVSRMNDNNWFVHNGRHRCIRALLNGETSILATNLY